MNVPTESIFSPIELTTNDSKISWGNLTGCSFALALAQLAHKQNRPHVIITQDIHTAEQLKLDLQFFSPSNQNIYLFPDWETLPFDPFSPHEDIVSKRLDLLSRLPQLTSGIIIASTHSIMHRLTPKTHSQGNGFNLKNGTQLNHHQFCNQLVAAGYHSVDKVFQHGEFALRGSIIDFFPMGNKLPVRIELFDNEIDSLRLFDPDSQRTIEKINAVETLLPAHEFPLTEDAITHFRQSWQGKFSGNPSNAPIYQAISQAQAAAGCQYYLPLFFDQLATFFDYLPSNCALLMQQSVEQIANEFLLEIKQRHEQLCHNITRPICAPAELFLSVDELFQHANQFQRINWQHKPLTEQPGYYNYAIESLPSLAINHKNRQPLLALSQWIKQHDSRVLFCAQSAGRQSYIQELLNDNNIKPTTTANWHEFCQSQETCAITINQIERGCRITTENIAIISENELFGQHPTARSAKQQNIDPNLIIRNLLELKVGAPVVHTELGVGRYLGLKVITTDNIAAEYLTLEYANNDKVYIPIHDLHLILRYTGSDADHAPLQRLGSKQWGKAKLAAKKRATDVAAELLDTYSQRQMKPGFPFSDANINYPTFCQQFAYIETEDQRTTIQAVIQDMKSTVPMDRLVCGDVGFGKTEVAMRAAFIAAQNNKQTIILVPTTLLANQHYSSFLDRFSQWPINVVILSRMQTVQQDTKTLAEIKSGKADIIIGTHKLLNESIQYHDLGLLIIDEEHRFGVKQKEKIKALRAHIDILTLTATPIPRTLNMALSGSRDISIIATPPDKRLSVKTFVHEYQTSIVKEALMRELMRGGQVIFLHNDIATIQNVAKDIHTILPQASVAVAHAQLAKNELAAIMTGFYQQKYNILISTTIVESGIDIPTANTIIINNANHFGLAELHQLRGRVGRSHHQAYAYLFIKSIKALNKDALKRLEVISELSHLGAGFILSTHDLEIRGAGALLGEQQSGHIQAVGFSLYLEMIEQAVNDIKAGKGADSTSSIQHETKIDLKTSALLPDDYIQDVNIRLQTYKQLAECKTIEAIKQLKIELIDRFGPLPIDANTLFSNTQLKLYAKEHDIEKISLGSKYGYLQFTANPKINFNQVIQLIQQQPTTYALTNSTTLRFTIKDKEIDQTTAQIYDLIKLVI